MAHIIGRIRRRIRRGFGGAGRVSSGAKQRFGAGRLQAKLQVGPQNDAYEREADSVAAKVMNTPDGAVQRACAACEEEEKARRQAVPEEEEELQAKRLAPELQRQPEEEEEEMLQAKRLAPDLQRQAEEEEEEMVQAKRAPDALQRQPIEEEEEEAQMKRRFDGVQREAMEEEEEVQAKACSDGSFQAGAKLSADVKALKGRGIPLSSSARAFFEPRFGADFSDVRVHTGPQAQRAAKDLGARAFTMGRDVVFGEGEYAPHSQSGGTLLAHELTHVLQQGGAAKEAKTEAGSAPVQRWSIGGTPVPAGANWEEVPDGTGGTTDHRPRLGEARSIVSNLLSSTRCQNYFRDNCENGSDSSLRDAFNGAQVYHMAAGGNLFGQNELGTGNIAYNRKAYNQGKWFLAATLLHELYHVCAPTMSENDRELNAENAVEKCRLYAPLLDRLSVRAGAIGTQVTLTGWGFGPTQGSGDRVELGGVTCPVVSWIFNRSTSSVAITVTIPEGAASGALRVWNNGVRSNPKRFSVT